MHKILESLYLGLRPEKTFVGRSEKGFDILGYQITFAGLSPSEKVQKKAFEKARQRPRAKGVSNPCRRIPGSSPRIRLKRWKSWSQGGLPEKILEDKQKTLSVGVFIWRV